jgi:uncharacterized protein YhaN
LDTGAGTQVNAMDVAASIIALIGFTNQIINLISISTDAIRNYRAKYRKLEAKARELHDLLVLLQPLANQLNDSRLQPSNGSFPIADYLDVARQLQECRQTLTNLQTILTNSSADKKSKIGNATARLKFRMTANTAKETLAEMDTHLHVLDLLFQSISLYSM